MRRLVEKELLLATNNEGKIKELEKLLAPFAIKIKSARDYDLPDPAETENSFIGNAKLKAAYFSEKTGLPALADDSGLCVHGLGDQPGVYTARYADSPTAGMKKINEELGDNPDRGAHFACCLVIAWPDGDYESFEARSYGTIAAAPRGDKGFAYDPIFIPEGYDRTFGEMTQEEKAELSHRGRALQMFVKGVLEY